MKYKVIRTCYWQRRLYEAGEEVELQEENVPEHFKAIGSIKERLADREGGLDEMNVGQLQKLARANGLKLEKTATKEELLSALRGE